MEKQIQQVTEFHKTYGLPVREELTLLPKEEMSMRIGLIAEETGEIVSAFYDENPVEIVDGIVDLLYVTIGLAIQMGASDKLIECFDEVQRSNMSKLDENGLPIVRADGKILKGDNYSPPDLKKILIPQKV